MAEFGRESSTNLAHVATLQGNTPDYDDPNLAADPSHFHKYSDPNTESLNPFSSEASSMAARTDYTATATIEATLTHFQNEDHDLANNEREEFQHISDDLADLPADFGREATHSLLDGGFASATTSGRGDEAEEVDKENVGSNPFTGDGINQERVVLGEACLHTSRPLTSYNPFLNDEEHHDTDEVCDEDEHSDNSQEAVDHFHEHGLGGPFESAGREQGGQRALDAVYDLLEEEEDDVDIQMEPVENIQHIEEIDDEDRADVVNEQRALCHSNSVGHDNGLSHISSTRVDEYISFEDTHESELDESVTDMQPSGNGFGGTDFEKRPLDSGADFPDNFTDERNVTAHEYLDTNLAPVNSETCRSFEEKPKDHLENTPPCIEVKSRFANSGFPEDVKVEEGNILQEEGHVENEAAGSETAHGYDNKFSDCFGGERIEKHFQFVEEMDIIEETRKTNKDEEAEKIQECYKTMKDEIQEDHQSRLDEHTGRFQEIHEPIHDDHTGRFQEVHEPLHDEDTGTFQEINELIHDDDTGRFQEVQEPIHEEVTSKFQEIQRPIHDEVTSKFQEIQRPIYDEVTSKFQEVQGPIHDEVTSKFQELQGPIHDEVTSKFQELQGPIHDDDTSKFQEELKPSEDTGRFQEIRHEPLLGEGVGRFQENYEPIQDEGTSRFHEGYEPIQGTDTGRFQETDEPIAGDDTGRFQAIDEPIPGDDTKRFQECHNDLLQSQDAGRFQEMDEPIQVEKADRFQEIDEPIQVEKADRFQEIDEPIQVEKADRFQEVPRPIYDEDTDRTDRFKEMHEPKQDEDTNIRQAIREPIQDEDTARDRFREINEPMQDEDMVRDRFQEVHEPIQGDDNDRFEEDHELKHEDTDRSEEIHEPIHDKEMQRLDEVEQTIKDEEVKTFQDIKQDKEYTVDSCETYTGRPCSFNNVEQSSTAQRGNLQDDEVKMGEVGARYEKGYNSYIDSDIMSSEYEDRSFVDNLSELTSPAETIPQPLPSPPEPTTRSPFDPLAPCDTPSPCQEQAGDLGQHGEVTLGNNAAGFLPDGEMEGETKFGVDGTAITTSVSQNNSFLHSDEEEDGSQNQDLGGFTTTGTTETETSIDGEYNSYQNGREFEAEMEGNKADNALMSMSMEGSFYDDGGELMGGEDRRNQQQSHLYEDGYITEESSQHDSSCYEPKQESFVVNPDEFGQKVLNELDQDSHRPHQGDNSIPYSHDDFDPLHSDTEHVTSAVNGFSDDKHKGHLADFDSLMDAPFLAQGLQTPVTVQAGTTVDNVETNFAAHAAESSVSSQKHQQEDLHNVDTSKDVTIPDLSEKVDKPSSKKVSGAEKDEKNGITPAATGAETAAAKVETKTTTVKKSPAKSIVKTPTTLTTTKVTKEIKTTNGKATTTKKLEITTTTTSKPSPRKPTEPRPTSTTTTERKTSARAASPTKSAGLPATTKSTTPLPSYAQPVTPRKPRTPTTEEKKKATPTSRASSAAPLTPRPQSVAAPLTPRPQSVAASSNSTTTSSATKSTMRTSVTISSTTSRTAQLARPKSSPTKLTNGIASSPVDSTKSPTKKYGIDSKNEGYKPGGGNVKIISEKSEFKATSKVDAGSKSLTHVSTVTKSPTKQATLASPKSGEVKSKIGSLDGATHTPGGGNVKIIHKKMDFTNVSSKIGSKDNMDYKPGGGHVKIENRKVKVEAKSKIGSLENAAHKPGGGDKKIEVQKTEWKAQSKIGSLDSAKHVQDGDTQADKSKLAKNGPIGTQGSEVGSEHGAAALLNGSASEI